MSDRGALSDVMRAGATPLPFHVVTMAIVTGESDSAPAGSAGGAIAPDGAREVREGVTIAAVADVDCADGSERREAAALASTSVAATLPIARRAEPDTRVRVDRVSVMSEAERLRHDAEDEGVLHVPRTISAPGPMA